MRIAWRCKVLVLFFLLSELSVLSNDFEYCIDSTGCLKVEELPEKGWFSASFKEPISLGYNECSAIWCKLKTTSLKKKDDVFFINNFHLDSIQQFSSNKQINLFGDRTDQYSPYINGYVVSKMDLSQDSIVILRIKKILSFIDFSIEVKEKEDVSRRSSRMASIVFVTLGIALALLILNTFIYYYSRSRKYIYYLIYSVLCIIYIGVNTGVYRTYFFSDYLFFSELRIFIGTFWYLVLTLFVNELLLLKKHVKWIHIVLTSMAYFVFCMAILSLICLYNNYYPILEYTSRISYLLFFIASGLVISASILTYKKNRQLSVYVLVSFLPHIIWALSIVLTAFEILPRAIRVDWLLAICIYEMILFSYILTKDYFDILRRNTSLRIELLKQERRAIKSIENVQIKERRGLANILHDNYGMELSSAVRLLELEKYHESKALLMNISKGIRELSHAILPKALEQGAFADAVRDQIEHMKGHYPSVQLLFREYDFPDVIDTDLAYTLYLVSLELIQNALKHSQANQFEVEFYNHGDSWVLSFSDNGVGMESGQLGFGLESVKKRVRNLGGEFVLDSSKEIGTTVLIVVKR